MIRVGFTGTQAGFKILQIETFRFQMSVLRSRSDDCEFHHGDCIGCDTEAHQIASELGFKTVCHPPISDTKRSFTKNDFTYEIDEYLRRNHRIVDVTNALIATPKTFMEELRSGTWSTVRYARKCGKPIMIIQPDGTLR